MFGTFAKLSGGFSGLNLEDFQELAFGMSTMFGGPDVQKEIEKTVDDFAAAEDVFLNAARLMGALKTAVAAEGPGGGKVTQAELDAIIYEAETIDEAASLVLSKVRETLGLDDDDAGEG